MVKEGFLPEFFLNSALRGRKKCLSDIPVSTSVAELVERQHLAGAEVF
jgi:hypothetical protein